MEPLKERILVSAPNRTGELFIRELIRNNVAFAALVNNRAEMDKLKQIGVKEWVMLDTIDQTTWILPDFPVGKVFLFETSQTLCCRYIQICRTWTVKPIYVITHTNHPRLIYKGLGAAYVIHTYSSEVSFLAELGG
ncbi:MAG: hypothetical protein K0R67_1620 [Paenibacillus sp.]|jgi:hypothetical protein|nr:hypothetical protein [Paenibacillus sp.]